MAFWTKVLFIKQIKNEIILIQRMIRIWGNENQNLKFSIEMVVRKPRETILHLRT